MPLFAIGDLHLPGHGDKPMDVFGAQWEQHFESICRNWQSAVGDDDVVLIPGDISWAMYLPNAMDDLRAIARLPGRKVLLRGNHDYWWSSITKVREALPEGMYALQNDSISLGGYRLCGTRGWTLPGAMTPFEPEDEKILAREVIRLELSLAHAQRCANGEPLVVMTHFPPLLADGAETAFTRTLERYPVRHVVYGHLHGAGIKNGFSGMRRGVEYQLVSCDALGFAPQKIDS